MGQKVVEIALEAGRKRQSAQTGYVHLFIEDPEFSSQDSIPSLENFLYAYALLRSRKGENIQEARALIEKLLHFEVKGNFPIYLHEFPVCRDRQLSSQFLPPIFYMLKECTQALGEVLSARLKVLGSKIVEALQKEPLSAVSRARVAAFLGEFSEGDWIPSTAAEWAEYAICAQMEEKSLEKVFSYWDAKAHVYIGPTKEYSQERKEPALTLLDLFMGEAFNSFSARALRNHSVHLKAALVHPCQAPEVQAKPFSFVTKGDSRQGAIIYFGDALYTHSVVVEGKKGSFSIQSNDNSYDITYTYPEEMPKESEDVELAIFANDDLLFSIGEEKGTAFHSGDVFSLSSMTLRIEGTFKTNDKEGSWIGLISKGNRLFQKDKAPYTAHDLKIGWRTLRRKPKASVTLTLKLLPLV